MASVHNPEELLSFPCQYEFKAFGDGAEPLFADNVRQAVSQVLPVGEDALRIRFSSGGRYQCVTVLVTLQNGAQLSMIYDILRRIEGLRYLL
jgi:putative lipoic acid-binding regulatory protein